MIMNDNFVNEKAMQELEDFVNQAKQDGLCDDSTEDDVEDFNDVDTDGVRSTVFGEWADDTNL
jgi:hypothetical protein